MKKNIFKILCFLFCTLIFANVNQASNKADIVILLDNSGTMLPYYDEVNTKVLTEICDNFVRLGDTVHLISFNEKPVTEISQPVKTEADIYKLISRFNLLYPLGPYTDFPSALTYAQQYMASLDVYNQKVLIIISDGLFNPATNSTFYNKTPEEINSVIDSTISKMKSEGSHIYYIKAPFPENLNLKSLEDGSTTNVGDESDESVYFEYGSALENLEEVETSALIPDEDTTYNSDSFIGPILSMPELSTKKDFGNKKLNFTLPITIKNTSDEKIKLELTQILINENNVLDKSVFVKIPAKKSKKINAKIKMPEDTKLGQQQIFAECVFADNVRTRPQFLDFFVNFKSGTNIFANFKNIGFAILIILLILLAIIALLLFILSISKNHKENEEAEKRKNKQEQEDATIYNEAKNITDNKKSAKSSVALQSANEQKDSNTTVAKKSTSSSKVVSDKSNSDTLNSYGKSNSLTVSGDASSNRMNLDATKQNDSLTVTGDGSSNRMNLNASKQKSILTLDGTEKYKDSNIGLKLESNKNSNTDTSAKSSDNSSANVGSNKMTMPTFKKPEGLKLPAIGTKAKNNSITPASSSDAIEAKSDKDIILELYVEGQNKNIGKRNIHTLSPGSRRSVGGGLSSFSIFLVQVPSSIAEVRYDGESCSLALLQPEYFPEATSNIIENCINQKIKVRSDKGYEMNITIKPYEDQTDKLNNLLLSIFDDSQKQRYSKN
jgi:hypothetical protein